MPALLPPTAATYVAVPSQAQPVQPKPQQQAQQPAAPQAPANPFKTQAGPPILLIPHEPTDGPTKQQRGEPIRLAAKAPAGGFVTRGIMARGGEFLPKEAYEARPAPTHAVPSAPRVSARERLRGVMQRRRR